MSDLTTFSVQMPHELRDKLTRLAQVNGRKCSDQVRFQIRQAYSEVFDAAEVKAADVAQGAPAADRGRDD